MDSLTSELQNAIRVLEQLSEQKGAHGDEVGELLDQLYQQKMALSIASVYTGSPDYKLAVETMRAACAKAKAAQRDKGRLGDALQALTDATGKVNRVLDNAP